MLQRLLFAWQPSTTIVTLAFTFAMLLLGEYLAAQTRDGNFEADPSKHHHHVWFTTRRYSLPNYWVWYEKEAVHEAIEAQGLAIDKFLYSIIFNAAMGTPAVAVGFVFALMFVVVRTIDPISKLNWVWLLPVFGFFCDVTEDILLLVITLGYPFHQYPRLMVVLQYCSLFKFVSWLITLVVIGVLGAVLVVKGPRKKESRRIE